MLRQNSGFISVWLFYVILKPHLYLNIILHCGFVISNESYPANSLRLIMFLGFPLNWSYSELYLLNCQTISSLYEYSRDFPFS